MLAFVRTPRGVVKVGQALLLAIIAAVLGILTSVFSLLLLSSSSTYNYMTSGFVALMPLAFAGVIVGLASLIMYVIGFFEMYEGRYEFEHIHERNMGVAFVLFVLSIAFGVSASMYGGVTGLFSFGLWVSATFVYVAAFLGVAQAVAVALLLSTPLRSLSTPDINSRLNQGVALYILGSVIAGIGSVLLSRSLTYYPQQSWSISVPPYFWPFLAIGQSISILGLGLFWYSYKVVDDRFHRGELRPVPRYPTYFYPPPFQAPPPPR